MGKKKNRVCDMEPDDEIETEVGDSTDVLVPHTFEQGLEMAFAEKAVIIVTCDRRTGRVNIDGSLSTPMETWAVLARAVEISAVEVELPAIGDEEADAI